MKQHTTNGNNDLGALVGSSANDVRDLVIDRIATGSYPVGSQLPTARELAAELGVHRNTVAKSYRMLADLGLVSTNPGRGTFVTTTANDDRQIPLRLRMERAVDDLVISARRIGIGEPVLRAMLDERIAATYSSGRRRGAFVECNWADVHGHVAEVESLTGVRLAPLLLDDVLHDMLDVVERFDVLFTSLFHIKELTDAARSTDTDVEILTLSSTPDENALEEIARIRPDAQVLIVASNLEGGQRYANLVRTYSRASVQLTVEPDDETIRSLAAERDVIVCARSRVAQVQSLGLSVPVIGLPFHISARSAAKVTDALGSSAART